MDTDDYCPLCDYDEHLCRGCGEPLDHDGRETTGPDKGRKHGTRCVD